MVFESQAISTKSAKVNNEEPNNSCSANNLNDRHDLKLPLEFFSGTTFLNVSKVLSYMSALLIYILSQTWSWVIMVS